MSEISVKQNQIGKIPKGWEIVKLEEFIDIYDKERIPLSEMERANRKGVYPYCGANGVLDYIDDYIFEGEFILLAEDGGSYGKFENSCYLMNGKFWVNNHAHIIKVKKNKSTNRFLLYMLNFLDLRPYVVGSTRVKLNQEYLRKINVFYPPLLEQQKIAEILGAVDEAIEKVDKAIEKTERLKKGLMQELLTKGIGHKEFKDSKVGKIPKEWEVMRLGKVTEINKESQDPKREFPQRKFLYIDIDSVENGTGVIKEVKSIVGKEAPSRARRVVHYNDIIMSTVRPYLKAFAIIPERYENQICSTGFAVLTCKSKLSSLYLLYTLFSKLVIEQCNRMMVGGQYPALNNSQVARIKIPLAPLPEQQKIAEILSTVDKKIEIEKKRKEKLERIKKGLMQDLLTGRKRVKI